VGVFGKYRRVMRPDGREVSLSDLLDQARAIVTAFALEQLGLSSLDAPSRFYILYRLAYGGEVLSFDEGNKLAKSAGAELDALSVQHHLVECKGNSLRVLTFSERLAKDTLRRALQEALEEGEIGQFPEVDQLHLMLYLWRKGETEKLSTFLGQSGILTEDHPLWRTAQALLEVEQNHFVTSLNEETTVLAQLLGSKRSLLRQASQKAADARQLRIF
jgi:hypothetical protein